MNQKELKEILSNFSANSGAQLKYYIITSLFPNANKAEIKSSGEFKLKDSVFVLQQEDSVIGVETFNSEFEEFILKFLIVFESDKKLSWLLSNSA